MEICNAVRPGPSGVAAGLGTRTTGSALDRGLGRFFTGLKLLFFQFAQPFLFLLFFLGDIFLAFFILIIGFCQFVILLESIPD